MAHQESFGGHHLRLSAFLRVVDNIPKQPSRFRKQIQQQSLSDDKLTNTDSPFAHTAQLDLDHGSEQLQVLTSFDDEAKQSEYGDITRSVTLPVHVPVEIPHLGDEEAPYTDYPLRTSDSYNVTATNNLQSTDLLLRKDPVVDKSKVNKADGADLRILSARERRLPVDELTLVRTTTADGLPDPSGQATYPTLPLPITDIDPIDDSQMVDVQHVSAYPTPAIRLSRDTQRHFVMVKPTLAANRAPKRKTAKAKKTSTLRFDGFDEVELCLPLRPKPTANRGQKTQRLSSPRCGLVLTNGSLPSPSCSDDIGEPMPDSQTPEIATQRCQAPSPTLAGLKVSCFHGDYHQPASAVHASLRAEHCGVILPCLRDASEREIAAQLSRVTAPARRDDSDSEVDGDLVDQKDDTAERITSGMLGLYNSIGSHVVDELEYSSGCFQSATYRRGTMMISNDDFWTYYGAID